MIFEYRNSLLKKLWSGDRGTIFFLLVIVQMSIAPIAYTGEPASQILSNITTRKYEVVISYG